MAIGDIVSEMVIELFTDNELLLYQLESNHIDLFVNSIIQHGKDAK